MQPRIFELLPRHIFYASDDDIFEVALHEPSRGSNLPEALVHDIWRHHRFDASRMRTHDGLSVQIRSSGEYNTDAGPDFRGARVVIDGQAWAGDVEIHLTSYQWKAHRHAEDPRYNSVILHVALFSDEATGTLRRPDGTTLPELVLAPLLQNSVRKLLHTFLTEKGRQLPCTAVWGRLPDAHRETILAQAGKERLIVKVERLTTMFGGIPDPEELLYLGIMEALGYARNQDSMLALAERVPMVMLATLSDKRDVEAALFGAAGLLPEPADMLAFDRASADYVMELRERYSSISTVLDMAPMSATSWLFFRLRPNNFPTVRIAQAAALFNGGESPFMSSDPIRAIADAAVRTDPLGAMRRLFHSEPDAFWRTHVRFGKASTTGAGAIGRDRVDAIISNVVAPLLILLSDVFEDKHLHDAALHIMRRLPADENEVTRLFSTPDWKPPNALASQGMHHLYSTMCRSARCLSCRVGREFLSQSDT